MSKNIKSYVSLALAIASAIVAFTGEDTVAATIAMVAFMIFTHDDGNKDK